MKLHEAMRKDVIYVALPIAAVQYHALKTKWERLLGGTKPEFTVQSSNSHKYIMYFKVGTVE